MSVCCYCFVHLLYAVVLWHYLHKFIVQHVQVHVLVFQKKEIQEAVCYNFIAAHKGSQKEDI